MHPEFRVGIAMGEVLVADETITGAGVVLAQRIERLAVPGGVCITGAIHEAMPQRMPFRENSLGERELEGFGEPVRVYAARLESGASPPKPVDVSVRTTPSAAPRTVTAAVVALIIAGGLLAWFQPRPLESETGAEKQTALPPSGQPSIAVLPFENMSGDPGQNDFADGLSENIIASLSRSADLHVAARHSSFKYKGQPIDIRDVGRELGVGYVLEGSIHTSAGNVRVIAQLIDAESARHVWAERIDHPPDDWIRVQDDITDHIVGVIASLSAGRVEPHRAEPRGTAGAPAMSLGAGERAPGGLSDRFTEDDNLVARQLLEKALEIAPEYSRTTAKTTWIYLQDYWNGWAESPEGSLRRAVELASTSVSRKPNDAWSHWSMASVLLLRGQHDAAIREYRRALEISPRESDLRVEYGWALTYAGRPEVGIQLMESAIRLEPHHPDWYLWDLAWGYFVSRRYEDAIAALERREQITNFAHLLLAASYAQMDRAGEAASALQRFRELEPDYSIEVAARREPFKHPQDREHWLDALRKAGLP
jgi:adenylate cyclase